jgi:NADH-quinone oxidoreductase subunit E
MEQAEISEIINQYQGDPSQIIAILHDIQAKERYLPEDCLRKVASQLEMPISQIYHIATFFKAFSLKPKGRHQCTVCMGTACHVRGAGLVVEELERRLKIKAGDTTEDMEYSLETVNCVGACALGPVVIIDGEYYGNMNSAKVEKMLKGHAAKAAGKPAAEAGEEEEEEEEGGAEESVSGAALKKPRVSPAKSGNSAKAGTKTGKTKAKKGTGAKKPVKKSKGAVKSGPKPGKNKVGNE